MKKIKLLRNVITSLPLASLIMTSCSSITSEKENYFTTEDAHQKLQDEQARLLKAIDIEKEVRLTNKEFRNLYYLLKDDNYLDAILTISRQIGLEADRFVKVSRAAINDQKLPEESFTGRVNFLFTLTLGSYRLDTKLKLLVLSSTEQVTDVIDSLKQKEIIGAVNTFKVGANAWKTFLNLPKTTNQENWYAFRFITGRWVDLESYDTELTMELTGRPQDIGSKIVNFKIGIGDYKVSSKLELNIQATPQLLDESVRKVESWIVANSITVNNLEVVEVSVDALKKFDGKIDFYDVNFTNQLKELIFYGASQYPANLPNDISLDDIRQSLPTAEEIKVGTIRQYAIDFSIGSGIAKVTKSLIFNAKAVPNEVEPNVSILSRIETYNRRTTPQSVTSRSAETALAVFNQPNQTSNQYFAALVNLLPMTFNDSFDAATPDSKLKVWVDSISTTGLEKVYGNTRLNISYQYKKTSVTNSIIINILPLADDEVSSLLYTTLPLHSRVQEISIDDFLPSDHSDSSIVLTNSTARSLLSGLGTPINFTAEYELEIKFDINHEYNFEFKKIPSRLQIKNKDKNQTYAVLFFSDFTPISKYIINEINNLKTTNTVDDVIVSSSAANETISEILGTYVHGSAIQTPASRTTFINLISRISQGTEQLRIMQFARFITFPFYSVSNADSLNLYHQYSWLSFNTYNANWIKRSPNQPAVLGYISFAFEINNNPQYGNDFFVRI